MACAIHTRPLVIDDNDTDLHGEIERMNKCFVIVVAVDTWLFCWTQHVHLPLQFNWNTHIITCLQLLWRRRLVILYGENGRIENLPTKLWSMLNVMKRIHSLISQYNYAKYVRLYRAFSLLTQLNDWNVRLKANTIRDGCHCHCHCRHQPHIIHTEHTRNNQNKTCIPSYERATQQWHEQDDECMKTKKIEKKKKQNRANNTLCAHK